MYAGFRELTRPVLVTLYDHSTITCFHRDYQNAYIKHLIWSPDEIDMTKPEHFRSGLSRWPLA
jgi:hypothetical protein